MAVGNRQIYRPRNRVRNSLVNRTRQEVGEFSSQAKNKLKRKFDNVLQEYFGAEINLDEVRETLSNVEEMEETANSKVKEPKFPMFIFGMASFVDLVGLLDLTGVGWVLATGIEWGFKIILFFVMWKKVNSTFKIGSRALFRSSSISRKIFMKYFGKRLVFLAFLDSIPFIGIFASDAFFVYLAHKKHKKIVKQYMAFVSVIGKTLQDFYRKNPHLPDGL